MALDENDGGLRSAGERGDAEAMFELGRRAEESARQLLTESFEWFESSARAGSLNGMHAHVHHLVDRRQYDHALSLLVQAEREHGEKPAERLVSVSPSVLGVPASHTPEVHGYEGDIEFTIITPYPLRAAEAIAAVALRLMAVDDDGVELADEERWRLADQTSEHPSYTPNYLGDVSWCVYGVTLGFDTKGNHAKPMVDAMAAILRAALAATAVPAHITGWLPDIAEHFTQVMPLPEAED